MEVYENGNRDGDMPPNYSELEMKKFDEIDQEQFVKDAIEYAKTHPHE